MEGDVDMDGEECDSVSLGGCVVGIGSVLNSGGVMKEDGSNDGVGGVF